VGILNSELTVVTCSKKDLAGLRRTLNSLLNFQSDFPKLILVLSDYSKTEIEEIANEFRLLEPEIHQIPPAGIYNAQNFGLQKVKSNLMLILNGGDSILERSSLQKLVQEIGENNWGFGSCNLVNSSTGESRNYNNYSYSRLLHRLSLKFVPHPSVLVNAAKARDLGGFDLNYKIAADQKMLLQFAQISKPITIKETISSFELGGASSRKPAEIVRDFQNISNEVFGHFLGFKRIDSLLWKTVFLIRVILLR
jgi:hypothetical protein